MPMKTRLEEVNEELEHTRSDIYSAVIDIGSATVERYAELRIEKAELEKKQR